MASETRSRPVASVGWPRTSNELAVQFCQHEGSICGSVTERRATAMPKVTAYSQGMASRS